MFPVAGDGEEGAKAKGLNLEEGGGTIQKYHLTVSVSEFLCMVGY